ncbi:MAG TPA: ABC transporter permease [Gemmatimonadaceae bacterium]|jgi:putative ABC transport system permease protein|nr:ABC transporter permease [Gemmatimonadaceae bacterium]
MLMNDLRFAVRALMRSRTFTITAVSTLAFGISVNTAIFSVVDSVLLREPPFDEPERIVSVEGQNLGQGLRVASVAYADVLDWRESAGAFEEIAVLRSTTFNFANEADAERANGVRVSSNFFRVFGARPQLGRTFNADEETLGKERVVVLTDAYWRRRFGADPGVIGRQLSLSGWQYTVVGVMPSGFAYPPDVELWAPFAPDSQALHRGSRFIRAVGRLAPGATPERGTAELNAVATRLEQAYPGSNTGWRANARPIQEVLVGEAPVLLYTFLGAVAFVLLIACANVANLLLARASGRAREVAVRKALGASSWRLVRQLLTESVVLALAGAVVGTLVALWQVRLLKAVLPMPRSPWLTIEVSWRALVFTIGLAVVTGIIAGIIPALRLAGGSVRESLATGMRGAGTARRSRTQRGLVVAEVALAVVLLSGAGLLLASFARLRAVPPGFTADGVLVARLTLAGPRYQSRDAMATFYDAVLARLRETPMVEAAGAAGALPLSGSTNTSNFRLPGRPAPAEAQDPTSRWERVTPDYFRALGIPLRRGRSFTEHDVDGAPKVVVVSEAWARTFFPGEADVVGRHIGLGGSSDRAEIVGVVGDVRYDGLDEPVQPTMFFPYAQVADGGMSLVVRVSGDPATMTAVVREAVRGVDPSIPVYDMATMQERVSRSLLAQRLSSGMIGVFAFMALVLASVGVYGLIAYTVAERRHEIGIRLALGAQGRDVRRLVIAQGVRLTLLGVTIGAAGAVVIGRGLRGMLFGVTAMHLPTLLGVSATLLVVAALASWMPARRAARTDLLGALRGE